MVLLNLGGNESVVFEGLMYGVDQNAVIVFAKLTVSRFGDGLE